MKHTPGPWEYQEESDAYTHIVRAKNNYMICHLSQNTSGATEANARLIAAAPELLEAIKYYFRVLDEVNGKEWRDKPDHVTSKMFQAISKAE